ncbi:helix-turn-helix domain-containing protein [Prauserella endophytica]|uniref:Helix-turn-helix transcriptional regulator n=1 Tax=Prauserella endophytica TaxID=1592324 RepID=A0ABY2RYU8_9PSEU|nr:helix-turn-helix transcriptional regulator [Prauserella endophytica]TKG66184.1 helix-turn-helix transcriptional regulator [Prauserella endophytica]
MAATGSEKRANDIGPIGEHIAENVRSLRNEQRLTTRELAERLSELGRPIPPTGITRVEKLQRRVDADDLIALALALGVSPVRILLPPRTTERGDNDTDVAPEMKRPWAAVWRWAVGDQPLIGHDDRLQFDDPRVREFIRVNRPYEDRPAREAWSFLSKRIPAPFKATITDEGANLHRRVDWEEWVDTVGQVDDGER